MTVRYLVLLMHVVSLFLVNLHTVKSCTVDSAYIIVATLGLVLSGLNNRWVLYLAVLLYSSEFWGLI